MINPAQSIISFIHERAKGKNIIHKINITPDLHIRGLKIKVNFDNKNDEIFITHETLNQDPVKTNKELNKILGDFVDSFSKN